MSFKRVSGLKKHQIIHTNERPFKCKQEGCDKMFKRKTDMKKHYEEQYLGISRYSCKICNISTNNPNEHKLHRQAFHPELDKEFQRRRAMISCTSTSN